MSRRQQRRELELEGLRHAFWTAEDSTPAKVADTFEARATYERESLTRQVVDAVESYMRTRSISQHDLAEILGLSEGRVSQILSGDQNLTLKTVAGLGAALKLHFVVSAGPAIGGAWENTAGSDGGDATVHRPIASEPEFDLAEPSVPVTVLL